MMSDLKESGGLEENADFVAFLHWTYKLSPELNYKEGREWKEEEKKVVNFIVEKCRFGETGEIKILFDNEYTHYKDLIMVDESQMYGDGGHGQH